MKTGSTSDTSSTPVWRQILHLHRTAPLVFYTLMLLLVADVSVSLISPFFVPEKDYLFLYLSAEALQSTKRFIEERDPYLIYDEITGWRNRPNAQMKKWRLDEHGARTNQILSTGASRSKRLLFLGNSMTNGGTHVSNDETISAYVEDAETEALNFATMLYGLDQMYLAYTHQLQHYDVDVVIVGLSVNDSVGLGNRYVPFRDREEVNMPYFKPRFHLQSTELKLDAVPPKKAYRNLFINPVVIKELKNTDECYSEFTAYKRTGFLPFSGGAWFLYKKVKKLRRLITGDDSVLPLLKALMNKMVEEGMRRGVPVVFMILPDRVTTAPNLWRQLLPDHYADLVQKFLAKGYQVLDARQSLRRSGLPAWELYSEDNVHYSPAGNRVIAEDLRRMLDRRLYASGQ